jgi:hypothetical protein
MTTTTETAGKSRAGPLETSYSKVEERKGRVEGAFRGLGSSSTVVD